MVVAWRKDGLDAGDAEAGGLEKRADFLRIVALEFDFALAHGAAATAGLAGLAGAGMAGYAASTVAAGSSTAAASPADAVSVARRGVYASVPLRQDAINVEIGRAHV